MNCIIYKRTPWTKTKNIKGKHLSTNCYSGTGFSCINLCSSQLNVRQEKHAKCDSRQSDDINPKIPVRKAVFANSQRFRQKIFTGDSCAKKYEYGNKIQKKTYRKLIELLGAITSVLLHIFFTFITNLPYLIVHRCNLAAH